MFPKALLTDHSYLR